MKSDKCFKKIIKFENETEPEINHNQREQDIQYRVFVTAVYCKIFFNFASFFFQVVGLSVHRRYTMLSTATVTSMNLFAQMTKIHRELKKSVEDGPVSGPFQSGRLGSFSFLGELAYILNSLSQ